MIGNKVFIAMLTGIALLMPAMAMAVMPEGIMTLLIAKDKTRVYSSFVSAFSNNKKVVLLFHQAGSNRMEYEPVLSALHVANFDTLTVDQRSGGNDWDFENATVKKLGGSTEYAEAYPDLEAALTWAQRKKYKTIIVIGSSYSASLAIMLASRNGDKLDAVAAYSPGEYFADKNWIKSAVKNLTVPLYITGSDTEKDRVNEVLQWKKDQDITSYEPEKSVHGASMLRQDKNPEGYQANLDSLIKFLKRFK
jgi:alpha-beta hydrolase superfamily lysophospholipase